MKLFVSWRLRKDFIYMEKEFWKNIPRYAYIYQASTFGRIRRHPRMIVNNGTLCMKKGGLLSLRKAPRGYLRVRLYDNGKEHEEMVHRLVAETFIPNKKHLPSVIHKDGDKTNNRLENLAWSQYSDNNPTRLQKKGSKLMKPVVRDTGDATYVYPSITEASRKTGISIPNISRALHGRAKKAGGFRWRFL